MSGTNLFTGQDAKKRRSFFPTERIRQHEQSVVFLHLDFFKSDLTDPKDLWADIRDKSKVCSWMFPYCVPKLTSSGCPWHRTFETCNETCAGNLRSMDGIWLDLNCSTPGRENQTKLRLVKMILIQGLRVENCNKVGSQTCTWPDEEASRHMEPTGSTTWNSDSILICWSILSSQLDLQSALFHTERREKGQTAWLSS